MVKGTLVCILSSLSFAGMYYLVFLLAPLSGFELLGIRTIMMAPILLLIIYCMGFWGEVVAIFQKCKENKKFILAPLVSGLILGFLQWVFFWAPSRGYGIDITMGFFLFPLVMSIVGRFLYKEHLTVFKKWAIALAFFGVANQAYVTKGFSIVAVVVACGYPIYFIFRKRYGINNMGGLFTDTLVILPFASYLVFSGGTPVFEMLLGDQKYYWLLPIFALVSTGSIAFYISASSMLPMNLFGLLCYLEPVLLLFITIYMGKQIESGEWITYFALVASLIVLALEGTRMLVQEQTLRQKMRKKSA